MRRLLVFAVVCVLVVGFASVAGRVLIFSEPPAPADVIIVLGGNAPDRLRTGLALRAQGYAPLVIVSNERVHTHGLETTWLDLYRAGHSAVELPESALLVLDNPVPESTLDEAHRDADLMLAHGLRSAVLVTDAFHSRRAYLLFHAAFSRRGLEVRSVPVEDELDLPHWWSHPVAARRVVEEWTKLAWYAAQGALF